MQQNLKTISDCPYCHASFSLGSDQYPILYCDACGRMFNSAGACLNLADGYYFNFSQQGQFLLLDKSRPLSPKGKMPRGAIFETLRLLEKILSHFLWISLWFLGIYFLPSYLLPLFISLITFHFFFLGCRLTTLFLYGHIKPLIQPPKWQKIIHQIAKKPSLHTLTEYGLDQHPGFLANLALSYTLHGNKQQALTTLQKTTSLCAHPCLNALLHSLSNS